MTLPDVCGPVSPRIRIPSLRLRARGMGWQPGHPTLLGVIQRGARVSNLSAKFCEAAPSVNWQGREAITATQPAIYHGNWGCRMGQHCSLWIELKWGISRSDTRPRRQRVLVSTRSTMRICVPLHTDCEHSPGPTKGKRVQEKVSFSNLSYRLIWRRKKIIISHVWEKHTQTHESTHVCAHDTSAQTHTEQAAHR